MLEVITFVCIFLLYCVLTSECSLGLFFLTIGSVCSPQASQPCAWYPLCTLQSCGVPTESQIWRNSFALERPCSFLLLARVAAMHTHILEFVSAFPLPSLLDSDSTFVTVVQISEVHSKYWVGYTFPEWIQNHQEIFRLEETGILLECECAIFLIWKRLKPIMQFGFFLLSSKLWCKVLFVTEDTCDT